MSKSSTGANISVEDIIRMNPDLLGQVGQAPPQSIPESMPEPGLAPMTADEAIANFYGSGDRITQPDMAYYDQFSLPGASPAQSQRPVPVPIVTRPLPIQTDDPRPDNTIITFQNVPNILDFPPGLEDRIEVLENREIPTFQPFDPTDLQEQINALENRPPPLPVMFDSSEIENRLGLLESRPTIPVFDPTDLQDQITALQNRQTVPVFDPTDLQDQITALQNRPTVTAFDPTSLQTQITALQNRPTAPVFDPSDLQNQIDALQNRPTVTAFDPTNLQNQIDALQNRPTVTAFDPTSLQNQIDALNEALLGLQGTNVSAPSTSIGTVVTPTGITNDRMATQPPLVPIFDFDDRPLRFGR